MTIDFAVRPPLCRCAFSREPREQDATADAHMGNGSHSSKFEGTLPSLEPLPKDRLRRHACLSGSGTPCGEGPRNTTRTDVCERREQPGSLLTENLPPWTSRFAEHIPPSWILRLCGYH